jgi:hypothetical protein
MSRARILQANIKNLMVEEQVGEVDDLANHASMARRYSDEAVALAQQTQNKRLLAGAYIACGLTSANEFYEEWDVAKHFASLAGELLSPDDRDHLSKEILALKSRILRATGIDQTLRLWSGGLPGTKPSSRSLRSSQKSSSQRSGYERPQGFKGSQEAIYLSEKGPAHPAKRPTAALTISKSLTLRCRRWAIPTCEAMETNLRIWGARSLAAEHKAWLSARTDYPVGL